MKIFVYSVGGAVRDHLMGKEPKDHDFVVVGSTPEQMLAAGFSQVGASFPVFLHPETGEEYALARTERKIGAGYHGFETVHDASVTLQEDLARRDFTINAMAMAMDNAGSIIDPFNGQKDLRELTLRHVGPAFSEDPLRVVRMARFMARFPGFQVAPETWTLAQQMVREGQLNELPWERFAAEVRKVLETCTPDGCYIFFDVLHRLQAHEHVTFFAGQDLRHAARAASLVRQALGLDAQVATFAAVAFEDERAEHVGGAVSRDVALLLSSMLPEVACSAHAFTVLKNSGAWNCSETFATLLDALFIQDQLNVTYSLTTAQLVRAANATKPLATIGAELAKQGVKGAAIGAAITKARMEALVLQFGC